MDEQVAFLTKGVMSTLLDLRERVQWKRREISPTPQIMEDAADVQQSRP